MARKKKEDFDVVTASQTDDGTVVITSLNELSEERMNNVIRNAVASYDPENKQYSTYLKISASSETMTVDRIDELARGLQSSLTNVQTVNGIIRNYINKDDLIGITYDAIEANVNTEFKCSFAQFRFLYKGIIINHNKKPSQPTLKRRFFQEKGGVFSWPGFGKEWC